MSSIRSLVNSPSGLVNVVFFTGLLIGLIWLSRYFVADVDEGMLWSSAMKIAEGQVMYRDFFEFWTPGSVYFLGWFFDLFGFNFWVSRTIYVVVSLISYILLYLVLRKSRFGQTTSLISTSIFAAITMSHMALNHHWFAIASLLASIYFMITYISNQNSLSRLVLSGTMAATATLFMQYEGVVAIAGGWIVLYFTGLNRAKKLQLAVFTLPILLIGAVLISYFAVKGALGNLLFSTIFFPIAYYRETNSGPPSALWLYQASLLVLLTWIFASKKWLTIQLRVIIIYASAIQLVSLATNSYMHIMLLGFLLNSLYLLLLSHLLKTGIVRVKVSKSWLNNKIKACAQYVGSVETKRFALSMLLGLFLLAYGARMVEGIGTLWYKRGNEIASSISLRTPAGEVFVTPPVHGRISTIMERINQHIPVDKTLYFGPYSGYYYLLLNRQNPLPYSQLTPAYNPEFMFEHAVAILEREKPEYIVFLPRESPFPFGKENLLYGYIEERYATHLILDDLPHSYLKPLMNEPPDAIWQRKVDESTSKSDEY